MIIGITGTNGAGKGTVVEYLVKKHGFKHYSNSGLIKEELKRRGMPIDRDNTRLVGNELRRKHGPGYLAEENFRRATMAGGDAVIEALRAVGEAKFLKEQGAFLIGVDAEIQLRYERITGRGTDLDRLSFERFAQQDKNERTGTDEWDMNIDLILQMADAIVYNNGTPEELYQQIEAVLKQVGVQ